MSDMSYVFTTNLHPSDQTMGRCVHRPGPSIALTWAEYNQSQRDPSNVERRVRRVRVVARVSSSNPYL